MVRFSVILGLLFQSLVAICCGSLTAPRVVETTDGMEMSCCSEPEPSATGSCSGAAHDTRRAVHSHPRPISDTRCCLVAKDLPKVPASPSERYSGDTLGVVIAPAAFALIPSNGSRELFSLALRHEPPWPSGRALLAGECRWNL